MVNLQEKPPESLFELVERESWPTTLVPNVAIEIAKKHLVDSPEKALDTSSPLWFSRDRKHQTNLEISCDLLQMPRSKVRAVIRVKNVRNTTDLPVWMAFAPDALSERTEVTGIG
jgi:hypothetical protein